MTEKLDIIVAISMILSGLFMMLVGFDIIKLSSKKPEDVERMIVWRRKWGMFFKIGGIVMVILAIYLLIVAYLNTIS